MTVTRYDTPPTAVGRTEAQQLAARELAKPQYHGQKFHAGGTGTGGDGSPSPIPSTAVPPPPPTSPHASASLTTVILVIAGIIILVIALILWLRRRGRPRTEKKTTNKQQTGGPREAELTGAARHRRDAELAAASAQWAEAIRQRFRAVIKTLDERALLPDRPHRTADEAAADAADVLPQHGPALVAAARAFDEVEYGKYVGSEAGYAVITAVDDSVLRAHSGGEPAPAAAPGAAAQGTP